MKADHDRDAKLLPAPELKAAQIPEGLDRRAFMTRCAVPGAASEGRLAVSVTRC